MKVKNYVTLYLNVMFKYSLFVFCFLKNPMINLFPMLGNKVRNICKEVVHHSDVDYIPDNPQDNDEDKSSEDEDQDE